MRTAGSPLGPRGQHVRVVTAHPTQFYPGTALGIITDLTARIEGDLESAHNLLHQLGLTPFFQTSRRLTKKPCARAGTSSMILRGVAALASASTGVSLGGGRFLCRLRPGGDRKSLSMPGRPCGWPAPGLTLLRCYRRAFRLLRRRITFKGLDTELDALQSKVEEAILAIDSQVFDDGHAGRTQR